MAVNRAIDFATAGSSRAEAKFEDYALVIKVVRSLGTAYDTSLAPSLMPHSVRTVISCVSTGVCEDLWERVHGQACGVEESQDGGEKNAKSGIRRAASIMSNLSFFPIV